MLQNGTPLRKSEPGPPNSSDEHVSCTAPAMQKTSCQILCTCPTPKCDNTLTFCSFLTKGTVPCACQAKRHLNVQKCREHMVLCTLSLPHVLRATTACTFPTSELPKVVLTWCALYIMNSKCASRHNRVQFFIFHLASWLRTRLFLFSDLVSATLLFFLPLPSSAFHLSILSEV